MLSGISSYFWPSQSSLNLLDPEIDPAQPDKQGLSPIDHAVYNGQTELLPQLFKQSQPNTPISSKGSDSLVININLPLVQKIKYEIVSIDSTDLDNPESANFILLNKFLNPNSTTLEWQPSNTELVALDLVYGIKPHHLFALFAQKGVLQHLTTKYPQWLEMRDNSGNTPLHYAACSPDEHRFVFLAKSGANIFAANSENTKAIDQFVIQIQSRDPLQWSSVDILAFLLRWLPSALTFSFKNGYLSPQVLRRLVPFMPRVDALAVFAEFLSVVDSLQSQPIKFFLLRCAFIANYWLENPIPIIGLLYKSYVTYALVRRAFEGIKLSYNHFHRKPITALVMGGVKVANALNGLKWVTEFCTTVIDTIPNMLKARQFFNDISPKLDNFTKSVKDKCGEQAYNSFKDEPYRLAKEFSSLVGGYSTLDYPYTEDSSGPKFQMGDDVKCALRQFEKTYRSMLQPNSADYNAEVHNFYEETFKPFLKSYSSICLEIGKATGSRWSCISDLFSTYFGVNKPADNDLVTEAFCAYTKPANFKNLTRIEQLQAIPDLYVTAQLDSLKQEIGCLNRALEMLGLEDLCAKTENNKPLYKHLFREVSRGIHPDKNTSFEMLFNKLSEAKKITEQAFQKNCKKV